MADDLVELAARAVELVRRAGGSAAAATIARSRQVAVGFRDGRLESLKDSTGRGLSLEILVDGRYGAHRTTDLSADGLASFVAEATGLTRALEPDPNRQLPDPALFPADPLPDLELHDPAVAGVERDRQLEWLTAMDAAARADDRVVSATCTVSSGDARVARVTSNGFQAFYRATTVGNDASATCRDGDRRPEGNDGSAARFLSDLADPVAVAAGARDKALARIGASKAPTQVATMVVDPRAAGPLLGRLLRSCDARSVQQQQSFFAGKLSEKLFSDLLSIVDDPLVPRGLGSRPFDDEGLAARRIAVVEAGVVANLYVDTYYGRKGGLTPTTGAASNRVVALGDRDLAGWLSAVGSGIYVNSWLGGNADPTSGDFSLGLRGHLIEGGAVGRPVGEMNVTGNLVALFASLAGVGNDPFRYSATLAPTLVFENVSFSGA